MGTPKQAPTSSEMAAVARRIFRRLDRDIRDRRGIKHEWDAISDDVMVGEIRPTWETIITEEVAKLSYDPSETLDQRKALLGECDPRPCWGWWAPGPYLNKCTECGTHFLGAKLARHCAVCAYEKAPQ